jgi:hypothetical protein
MTAERKAITFEEFSGNLTGFFDFVIRENATLVVEKANGSQVALRPLSTVRRRRRRKTKSDLDAFRAAAGGWEDMDADVLIKHIEESRQLSSRPLDTL